MCTSPIRIFNKRHFSREVSISGTTVVIPRPLRAYNDVPCGKCPECLSARRNSYYFRCHNEYVHSKVCAFCTLTYDNDNLPTHTFHSAPVYDDSGNCVLEGSLFEGSFWDKSHVQSWLKRLNETLIYKSASSKGIPRLVSGRVNPLFKDYVKQVGRAVRYLVVCERGKFDSYLDDSGRTRMGTGRPHYHALLFLNPLITNITRDDLLYTAKKLWSFGHSYNVVVEGSTDDCSAIYYVCKYVTKKDENSYPVDISRDPFFCERSTRNRHLPFVLVSNYLGIDWLNTVSRETFLGYLSTGVPMNVNGKSFVVNIPSYYLNKVRYVHYTRDLFEGEHPNECYETTAYYDSVTDQPFYMFERFLRPASRYVSLPSSDSSLVESYILHNKAEHLLKMRRLILDSNELWRVWFSDYGKKYLHGNPYGYYPADFYHMLEFLDPDDLYLHIVESLGIDPSHTLDGVCDMLSRFSRCLTRERTIVREADYTRRLSEKIRKNPSMFNKKPL